MTLPDYLPHAERRNLSAVGNFDARGACKSIYPFHVALKEYEDCRWIYSYPLWRIV